MTKRQTILIGILLVVAVGAVVWGMLPPNALAPASPEASSSASSANSPASSASRTPVGSIPNRSQTFKSLLAQNLNRECTYVQVSSTQTRTLIDISQGKLYGEFRTTDESGTAHNNLFVYDGRYLYSWQEGERVGTKSTLTSLSQLPFVIPAEFEAATYGTGAESVSWNCHPWIPDATKLVPPSYVTFTSS